MLCFPSVSRFTSGDLVNSHIDVQQCSAAWIKCVLRMITTFKVLNIFIMRIHKCKLYICIYTVFVRLRKCICQRDFVHMQCNKKYVFLYKLLF